MKSFSLYIHIPFCVSKCYYCDFTSFSKDREFIEKYMNRLILELSLYKEKLLDYHIKTIFIGGGTPSAIDAHYIAGLLQYVYENFNINGLEEVSIEANPGTLNTDKVRKYKSSGINRVSLGVQSLNNRILKSIGRIHQREDFYNSLNLLRREGFNNINADLIFSLPGQTIEDVQYALSEIIKLNLEHVSLYSLIIENDTPLGNLYNKGLVEIMDEDLDRKIYHDSIKILKENGYEHYELSNFAKPNKKCAHNLAYWKIRPYLGVGISSHSNMFSKRFYNFSDFKSYSDSLESYTFPIEGEEIIHRDVSIVEYIIMGLRLIKGICKKEYRQLFSEDIHDRFGEIISKNKSIGLIMENDSHIALTEKGLDLANMVELDFYNIN